MIFLKKAWVLLRTHWYLPLIAGLAILGLLTRTKIVDWASVLKEAGDSHKKEVDAIDRAHEMETAARERALKRMVEAERQIREEYARNERILDRKKEKRLKKILKKLKDDPMAMANEIEKETGYRVIIVD